MGLDLAGYKRATTGVMLGGKKYVFTELTLSDMAEFRSWVVERRKATRDDRRQRLLDDAKVIGNVDPMKLLEALDRPPTEAEYEAEAETIEGVRKLAHLSLRHHHPEATNEDAGSIVTIASIDKVVAAMFQPNGEQPKKKRPEANRSRSKRQ